MCEHRTRSTFDGLVVNEVTVIAVAAEAHGPVTTRRDAEESRHRAAHWCARLRLRSHLRPNVGRCIQRGRRGRRQNSGSSASAGADHRPRRVRLMAAGHRWSRCAAKQPRNSRVGLVVNVQDHVSSRLHCGLVAALVHQRKLFAV
jgi:hypothetical protein